MQRSDAARAAALLRASHPSANGEVEESDPQKRGALSKRPMAPLKTKREKMEEEEETVKS